MEEWNMTETRDYKGMLPEELEKALTAEGFPKFRAGQLFDWYHRRKASSYEEMNNLPKDLRAKLSEESPLVPARCIERQVSKIVGTNKFLFGFPGEEEEDCVEAVLMRYHYGNSVCVSSQVGCRMGCTFCASGLLGRRRNLTASEMLEEVYAIERITGEKVGHVVIMGTGEPLDNYDHVIRFIRLLTHEKGAGISARNITLSTCGIVPGIKKLSEEGIPLTLALSLHASTQEKRERIMPIARRYGLSEVMAAVSDYFKATGRRVTFEYSLIANVNDSDEDASGLAGLARGAHAHVNLIPVNPVRETGYERPDGGSVSAFKNKLEKYGVNVSIRRALGGDIEGACGQLRLRHETE